MQRAKNMSNIKSKAKTTVYTRYPLSNVLIYNGTTIFHFLLGGIGIILGYNPWIGYLFGFVVFPKTACVYCAAKK